MQYLIMHGSYGSPEENWFRWLEAKLKAEGHRVILEQFPSDDWDQVSALGADRVGEYRPKQSLESWEVFFVKNILPKIKKTKASFVGHSIAPIFMLHMLNKYDFKFEQAIFVAPFFNIPDKPDIWQFYPVNKTFYSYDFNFDKIKKQIGSSVVVHGDNDPYVPATQPPLFAKKLASTIKVIPGGRHCGSNFKELPLIYKLLV